MTPGSELVEQVSDEIRVIRDIVEYDWLVGCVPTSVAIILGHWDRNGFDNLIDGDSSSYNANVKNAMASRGHYDDYYLEEGYSEFIADPGQSRDRHEHDSIADFLHSSRSDLGLLDGWTYADLGGAGLRGYAAHRGYEGFKTTYQEFQRSSDLDSSSFQKITDEIDAGRPVMLGVSGTDSGELNHSVVAFGYNSQTNQLLVHDGWGHSKEPIWIDFVMHEPGVKFGIGSATFVQPPDELNTAAEDQYLVFDGPNIFDTYVSQGHFSASGQFVAETTTLAQNLWGKASVGIASEDGHALYQLLHDGLGSTSLVKLLAHGDGQYSQILLNSDSGLEINTIGLATADAKLFYQLVNDGYGTAALYEARLQYDGTFTTTLLNKDSGAALNTVGLSTTDGENFKIVAGGAYGNSALYDAQLNANGQFIAQLANANSTLSGTIDGIVAWTSKPAPPAADEIDAPVSQVNGDAPVSQVNGDAPVSLVKADAPVSYVKVDATISLVKDVSSLTQHLNGSGPDSIDDVFQINGNSQEYDWAQTLDGKGTVVWNETDHDLLYDFELIRFNDQDVSIVERESENPVNDIAHVTQYLTGQGDNDVFVLEAYEQEFDWADTLDGKGTVVWSASGHDLLYGFEKLQFIDGEVTLDPAQPKANVIVDDASQTQYLRGETDDDVFALNGDRDEFGWSKTDDGGYVVWNHQSKAHDLLYEFESLEFEDAEIDLI